MTAPAAVSLDPIKRACIMVKGDLGMCHPIDAHDIEFEVQQYAQYRSALKVSFRPNRARSRRYMNRPHRFHRLVVAYQLADDELNRLYWLFCRCARAKPVPSSVCRRAYRLRDLVARERRRLRQS